MRTVVYILLSLTLTSCIGGRYANKLVKRGEENFANGKYREATANFNNALLWNRNHTKALYWLGRISEEQQRAEDALFYYEKVLRNNPSDKETAIRAAHILINKTDYRRSVEVLEKAFNFNPNDTDIGYLLSLSLTYLGKADDALVLIDRFGEMENDARLSFAKALASDSLGLHDYALIFYRRAIDLDSLYQKPYFSIIRLLENQGQTELKKRYLATAIKNVYDPFFLETYLSVLLSEYKWNEAITVATTLYNLTSRIEFIERRARLFQIMGQTFNALNDYNFILSIDPNHLNSLYNRAILQMRLDNEKGVFNDLNRFLELSDSTTPSWQIERAREIMSDFSRNILPPKIKITYPNSIHKEYLIYDRMDDSLLIRGNLYQKAFIKRITINNQPAKIFSFSQFKKVFAAKIPRPQNDSIIVSAIDIYGNATEWSFIVMENETSSPEIIILSPTMDSSGVIQQTHYSAMLRLKLLIADKSILNQLTINNRHVPLSQNNRTLFLDTIISIPPFDTITISASDIFGNVAERKIFLHPERKFDLEGKKDVLALIFRQRLSEDSASSTYKNIDSLLSNSKNVEVIIHSPLSKNELERFLYFSLPSMVKKGGYRHVLLFFEQNNQIISETLYWIPPQHNNRPSSYFNLSFLSIVRNELPEETTLNAFVALSPEQVPVSLSTPSNVQFLISSPETPLEATFCAVLTETLNNFLRADVDVVISGLAQTYPRYHKAFLSSVENRWPKYIFR